MSEIDPYLKWLGIREVARPINHYRLLGLEMFESDPEVISLAADRQMSHIHTYQNGPHGELSQKILSELAVARRCLLDPSSRQIYDQQIGLANLPIPAGAPQAIPQAVSAPSVSESVPPPICVQTDANVRTKQKKREQNNLVQGLVGWVVGAVAAIGIGGWIVTSGVIPGIDLSKNVETTEVEPSSIVPSDSSKAQTPPTRPGPLDQTSPTTSLDQPLKTGPSANPEANSKIDAGVNSEANSGIDFGQSAFGNSFNKRPFPEMPASPQPEDLKTGLEPPPTETDPSEMEATAIPPKKSSPPPKKEIKLKQDELRSLYSTQIAGAKNNDQLIQLGRLLLNDSRTAQPNSPMHYVMLEQTIEVASQSGDALTAFNAIQELDQHFEIEYWDRATDMMETTASNAPRKKVNEFKMTLDGLIVESIEARKFEHGTKLAGLAISLAKRANDDKLTNHYKRQKQRITEHDRLIKANLKAQKTLLTEPDHPTSNLIHGEYLFVVENDIESALTYWANSKDERLENLVTLELQLEPDSPDQFKRLTELADAWEKMGQSRASFFKRKGLQRAIELNQLALPYVNGLDRRWVESNITRLQTLLSK